MRRKNLESLLKRKSGIGLDLGCGLGKQPGFVGIDKRPLPGVDLVWDLEKFPYPLPNECVAMAIGSHIVEHINPHGGVFIDFMNEVWRVMKPGGQLALVHPYAVNSLYVQDPTHCNPCNEATWQYFDHRYPLYTVYRPKPWEIAKGFPQWQLTGLMQVIMHKVLKPGTKPVFQVQL